MTQARIPIDRLAWVRWRASLRSVLQSEVGGRVWLLFGVLLALLIALNALNVVNSYVGRDFMTAIERRSMSGFVSKALLYLGVFAASTFAAVIYRFTEERLGLLWRHWLTRRLVTRYLEGATYYRLRERAELANPDQRIADDVRTFTSMTLSLMLIVLNTSFTIVAFSGVMWSISPELFGVAVGYAALGSGLTVLLGRPLLWLGYDQSDREASLRAELVHLRQHAESVAFLRREGRLRERILERVDAAVLNMRRIIAVNRNLGFFTTGYNYLIQLIPMLITAPLFIRGEAEFGVISQSSMAFSHLIGAFSLVVTQFQQISSYAVVIARLSALGEGVEGLESASGSGIVLDETGTDLRYDGLTLRSPGDGRVLVETLALAIPAGTRTLITGPDEASRVALFRATAGLWEHGEGRIQCPPSDEILFLPERPYLPPGTLRQALVRTGREAAISDERIHDVLRALGAADVLERVGGLETEQDWDGLLSLGEQQLLSVARLILAAPRFVLLDRPGVVLDAAVGRVLDLLATASITAVTFSPEEALAARHDARLTLTGDGRWTWENIREGSARR